MILDPSSTSTVSPKGEMIAEKGALPALTQPGDLPPPPYRQGSPPSIALLPDQEARRKEEDSDDSDSDHDSVEDSVAGGSTLAPGLDDMSRRWNDLPLPPSGDLPRSSTMAYPSPGGQATNHLALKTSKEPITGMFQIDPGLGQSGAILHARRPVKSKSWPWSKPQAAPELPNASFETRRGAISLGLAAVATAPELGAAPSRATVDVYTRKGRVEISVFRIDSNRRLSLRVETRSGHAVVLLPRNFSGPLHMRSKHGKAIVLPALQGVCRVVSTRKGETLALLGDSPLSNNALQDGGIGAWTGDALYIESRKGNVLVGLTGEDQKPQDFGFWTRFSHFISGPPQRLDVSGDGMPSRATTPYG